MRFETIRVKKPSWVRIVNPDPISILDMTWSYGSYVRIEPGGTFNTLFDLHPRTLAMYQPPHAPSDPDDAPPNVLVLYTPAELRLLAEGALSFNEPYERPMPRRMGDAPARTVRIGDRAIVPFSRMVRALAPYAIIKLVGGGPYRGQMRVHWPNRNRAIRPGGTMTVFTPLGEEPLVLLKVLYDANLAYRGEQCPSGHWFEIPEEEFLRMRDASELLRQAEAFEQALVVRALRSL